MIRLRDIRYVRLGTRDLQGTERFVREVLGLWPTGLEGGMRYYGSDERDHTLVVFDGDPAQQTVGFDVDGLRELDAAASALDNLGIAVHRGRELECAQRRAQAFIGFRDPSGNLIELVAGPARDRGPCSADLAAGITGFSHVGLCTTDAPRDERFWVEVLGARVSDRIGQAPLLRIDEVHHKVALFPAARCGVQHINHQVSGIDDVMRAWYRLRAAGVRIVFGPGRHPTSGAVFLYFAGPDGMVYEYSTGVRTIPADQEATYRPRQFPLAPESFCMWGATPEIEPFRSTLT
jgi:2,3-dihydroxy-p-cumate/2,3-dihydroxybenzoate 3,4-dioxygenase